MPKSQPVFAALTDLPSSPVTSSDKKLTPPESAAVYYPESNCPTLPVDTYVHSSLVRFGEKKGANTYEVQN